MNPARARHHWKVKYQSGTVPVGNYGMAPSTNSNSCSQIALVRDVVKVIEHASTVQRIRHELRESQSTVNQGSDSATTKKV